MLHENPGHAYHNEFVHRTPKGDDCALCFSGREVLMTDGELPSFAQWPGAEIGAQYLFDLDGRGYFLVNAKPDHLPRAALSPIDRFRNMRPQHLGFAGITASQLHRFYHDNAYCGRCASKMEKSESERALVCPQCGNTIYPKISPAVIVAITDGDRLLLTKYAGRTYANYALVAGFCECGEPVEDTVRREVTEEVGLSVKNIRYYASQPWSFSDSLLLGFYCEVDGSAEPRVDGVELAEATWFHRGDIPKPETLVSLTATMIEAFRNNTHMARM